MTEDLVRVVVLSASYLHELIEGCAGEKPYLGQGVGFGDGKSFLLNVLQGQQTVAASSACLEVCNSAAEDGLKAAVSRILVCPS